MNRFSQILSHKRKLSFTFTWIALSFFGCNYASDNSNIRSSTPIAQLANIEYPQEFESNYPGLVLRAKDWKISLTSESKDVTISFQLNSDLNTPQKSVDFYLIKVLSNSVVIEAPSLSGLREGFVEMEDLISRNSGIISPQTITNYSLLNFRALHFGINGTESEEFIKEILELALSNHYNTLIIRAAPGVEWDNLKFDNSSERWTKTRLKNFVTYAKSLGFEVIPEMKFLTHQKHLFQKKYKNLLYNEETYDPNNAEVYPKVFGIIDEVIEAFKPSFFHIGHDEVYGMRYGEAKKNNNIRVLPPEDYLKDVLTLHDYLKQKGITTMMWGDMLVSLDEVPNMKRNSVLGHSGYRNVRDKLPRDIIICDWHYKDKQKEFTTINIFNREGFEVWGATWDTEVTIMNFSKFVKTNESLNTKGMIATTWYNYMKDDKERMDKIKWIIETSGKTFWNAK